MRKTCLQCEKSFFGRSDKQFCSLSCKNAFHNREHRQNIEHRIDAELHHNRSILLKLMPAGLDPVVWPRELLVQHGFRFDLFTGMRPDPECATVHVLYDFEWEDVEDQGVKVRRIHHDEFSMDTGQGD